MPQLLILAGNIYSLILLVRVLFSWLPPESRQSQIYRHVYAVTEPVLRPVREALPPMQGFDFSPIVVFFILHLVISLLR